MPRRHTQRDWDVALTAVKYRPLVQHCYYRSGGHLYVGGIKSHTYKNNRCLVDPGTGVEPGLYECNTSKFHMLWDFKMVNATPLTEVEGVISD